MLDIDVFVRPTIRSLGALGGGEDGGGDLGEGGKEGGGTLGEGEDGVGDLGGVEVEGGSGSGNENGGDVEVGWGCLWWGE